MRKYLKKLLFLLSNFRSKYKISVRNPHNDSEVWYIYISALNIFSGALAFILVSFIVVVTVVAYTPVMDFIPGYPGNKARSLLVENNMRLDSLEHQLNIWNNYYDNITRIMDGKAPLALGSTPSDTATLSAGTVDKIPEDSILRQQMTTDGTYKLSTGTPNKGSGGFADMYTPVKGLVTNKFNPRTGMFGVDVATMANQPVMSVMDGTVVFSSWTPTEGSVVYVSHHGNVVSAYLHNARALKNVGERVKAGEVIAFTGSSSEDKNDQGYTQIQIWNNGTPVDPENFIVF